MTHKHLVGALVICALVSGCSDRQVYEGLRANKQFDCRQYPGGEYDDCMRSHDQGFDSYRQQRERYLEK